MDRDIAHSYRGFPKNSFMSFIDKNNTLEKLDSFKNIIVELGCGPIKHYEDSISIDLLDYPSVDIVGDLMEVLKQFPSSSVKKFYSSHLFEHLEDIPLVLKELKRVLLTDGVIEIKVPHFSNSFFYSDPTHTKFFGLYTFSYFFDDQIFSRKVPSYERIEGMKLERINLIFRSYRPHYISHLIRKFFGMIINFHPILQEIYEESFVNFISCYELHITAKKI